MKAQTRPGHRSMVNPAALSAEIQQQREEAAARAAAREGADADAGDPSSDEDFEEEPEDQPSPEEQKKLDVEKKAQDATPQAILKRLGIEMTAEDCNRLLFKGYVTKDIKITHDPSTGQDFIGRFKTLTSEEFDLVDELLAEEMNSKKMTVNGREARHSTWILAFSLTHINDAELQKPVFVDKKIDIRGTAESRVAIIRKLSPYVLDKASRVYGALSAAISLIIEDPAKEFIKKP